MDFDCRADNEDKVGFEAKVTLPDGEVVQLQFRDFARVPSEISMDFMGNDEGQLWAALRWGLISPKTWKVGEREDAPGVNVFRKIPASTTLKIHSAWQSKSGVTQGESRASATSSENTETS